MYALNAEMDRGLKSASHHEATVKMFHTYVRALPTGAGQTSTLSVGVSVCLSVCLCLSNAIIDVIRDSARGQALQALEVSQLQGRPQADALDACASKRNF